MLWHLLKDETGQGLVEYGLILALASIIAIGAVIAIKQSFLGVFSKVGNAAANPENPQ